MTAAIPAQKITSRSAFITLEMLSNMAGSSEEGFRSKRGSDYPIIASSPFQTEV